MMEYLVIIHNKFSDKIENKYFRTEQEAKDFLKKIKNAKGWEVLHKFKIKELK